ncbi:hypothetical protein [Klebsiella sp. CN_Kp109]|uniref:hypothetical protein n=1 Tax=Klebsiella sp. CN_Kp109 TaxID=3153427 RepID=UPI0032B37EB7
MNFFRQVFVFCGCMALFGCAVSERGTDDINTHKNSISYRLINEVKLKKCPEADDFAFYAENIAMTNKRVMLSIRGATCKMFAESFVKNVCKSQGGEWETHYKSWVTHDGQAYCKKNDTLLLTWFQRCYDSYGLQEPLDGRESDWNNYVNIESGFESSTRKKERLELAKANEENIKRKYALFLQGEPDKVIKSDVGTRICRLDEKTTEFVNSETQRAFYSGFIENKSGNKILIRYESHFDNFSASGIDIIRWEKPGNWFVCNN